MSGDCASTGIPYSHQRRKYLKNTAAFNSARTQLAFIMDLVDLMAAAPPHLKNAPKTRCFYEPRRTNNPAVSKGPGEAVAG